MKPKSMMSTVIALAFVAPLAIAQTAESGRTPQDTEHDPRHVEVISPDAQQSEQSQRGVEQSENRVNQGATRSDPLARERQNIDNDMELDRKQPLNN
ncbi:hypothetical protein ACFQDN_00015 [Pseudomonas asuensis]|jgi:Ni/Co efflux regulator RcnB|uniref:Uncharacterized protein n=1 Tax=Pseudomonas asuensis TaxID=1825787 RepID=A0ABQ2GFW8_9PSED|nr:hypothetical protein [Pseudomonas asuensis]GGL94551.1 hypothetical protein GCM10009425_01910 [Pseudomonas asuensis]